MATPRKYEDGRHHPRPRRSAKPIDHLGIPLGQLHDPLTFHDLWPLFNLKREPYEERDLGPYQWIQRGTVPMPANLDEQGWPVWEREEFMEHAVVLRRWDPDTQRPTVPRRAYNGRRPKEASEA